MSNPSFTNIITGGAVLWQAAVGTASPDETSIAYGVAWGGVWTRVGYTKAPIALIYDEEVGRFDVEEELTAVKSRRIAENMAIETVLAELTAGYLNLILGGTVATTAAGASQRGYEELPFGGEATLPEYEWGIEGEYVNSAGLSFPLRVFIHRANSVLNGNLQFSNRNSEYPGIPLRIDALADTTQAAGQKLAIFQRVTAEATS